MTMNIIQKMHHALGLVLILLISELRATSTQNEVTIGASAVAVTSSATTRVLQREGPRDENFRPPEAGDEIDCDKLLPYLQLVYPQCRDSADEDEEEDQQGNDDDTRPDDYLIRRSLVHIHLQVGIKKQLTMSELRLMRRVISKAASALLNKYTPFQVPKPYNRTRGRRLLDFGERILEGGAPFTGGDALDDEDDSEDEDNVEPNRIPGAGMPFSSSQGEVKPRGNSNPTPSPSRRGSGGNGSGGYNTLHEYDDDFINNDDQYNSPRKSNVWLHHFFTGLAGEITTTANGDFWYYPILVEHMAWWKDKEYPITNPDLMANVTKICQQVGNATLQNGKLFDSIYYELRKYAGKEADINGFSQFDQEQNELAAWLTEDGSRMYVGWQDDFDVAQTEKAGDERFAPTYPIPLENDWGKREYFGSFLFLMSIVFSVFLTVCSIRVEKMSMRSGTKLSTTHLLTEEGVNEILQVGWKYQQHENGKEAQLFLQVYDKSKVGYSDDCSMLMGGIERKAIDDRATPESTAPTERETNTITNHADSVANESSNSGQPLSTTFTSSIIAPGDREDESKKPNSSPAQKPPPS